MRLYASDWFQRTVSRLTEMASEDYLMLKPGVHAHEGLPAENACPG